MNVYECANEMTVGEAPVGLFLLSCGELICISEYRVDSKREATIASSGENYCGGDDKVGHSIIIN